MHVARTTFIVHVSVPHDLSTRTGQNKSHSRLLSISLRIRSLSDDENANSSLKINDSLSWAWAPSEIKEGEGGQDIKGIKNHNYTS